ncbi:HD domain-containing protein [Streptomyces sp. NPDC006655]|uniref:HD domain-containing protein n=1 Tax=Streptomyces sp. NPDC006655 TaxID=3156898 RepID=UPI0034512FB2
MDLDESFAAELREKVHALYARKVGDVPFHGWHHVKFVSAKACEFAPELGADVLLVYIAALVHDVNYLIDVRTDASGGSELRRKILGESGASDALVDRVERIVLEAEIQSRTSDISPEAKALSDGDTLFKALPVTPVILAPRYMKETGRDLRELANKIVDEQVPLNDQGIYFYADSARERYRVWAETGLNLWRHILDSLDDPAIRDLVASVAALEG